MFSQKTHSIELLFSLLLVACAFYVSCASAKVVSGGVAMLNILVDGNTVAMDWRSSVVNVLPYSQPATTAEQKQQLAKVKAIIASPSWVSFQGINCQQKQATLDFSIVENVPKSSDHHAAQKDSKTGKADAVSAHIVYVCEDAQSLRHIDVSLFDAFASLSAINVVWEKGSRQGISTLRKDQTVLAID